jgi:bacillithiol system protein YtxJ
MSFLKSIFGNKSNETEKVKTVWNNLNNVSQLNEIIVASKTKPALIFKHSTRCSISRMALRQFENEYDLEDKINLHYLDLIEYRDISNKIASTFNVVHQSPQILLIKDGKSIYTDSHESINAEVLKKYI